MASLWASLPSLAFAAFYPPLPGVWPGTAEGSGFGSAILNVSDGDNFSFNFNFITAENENPPVSDWLGVGLGDPVTRNMLFGVPVGGVSPDPSSGIPALTLYPINNGAQVAGIEGDIFYLETRTTTFSFTLPSGAEALGFSDTPLHLAWAVYDLEDGDVATAVLVDNVKHNGALMTGGDFGINPFYPGGFFDPNGGAAGLFEWAPALDPLIDRPDDEKFVFISTYNTTLPPVPIPGAVWLLGSGLVGLYGARRKTNI